MVFGCIVHFMAITTLAGDERWGWDCEVDVSVDYYGRTGESIEMLFIKWNMPNAQLGWNPQPSYGQMREPLRYSRLSTTIPPNRKRNLRCGGGDWLLGFGRRSLRVQYSTTIEMVIAPKLSLSSCDLNSRVVKVWE